MLGGTGLPQGRGAVAGIPWGRAARMSCDLGMPPPHIQDRAPPAHHGEEGVWGQLKVIALPLSLGLPYYPTGLARREENRKD